MFFFQHPFADTIVPAGDLAFVDRCIGVEVAVMAAAQAPDNLHVVIVDGLGHLLHRERTADINRQTLDP
jgi:hypothetical protein